MLHQCVLLAQLEPSQPGLRASRMTDPPFFDLKKGKRLNIIHPTTEWCVSHLKF
jgi:hypothetical protein